MSIRIYLPDMKSAAFLRAKTFHKHKASNAALGMKIIATRACYKGDVNGALIIFLHFVFYFHTTVFFTFGVNQIVHLLTWRRSFLYFVLYLLILYFYFFVVGFYFCCLGGGSKAYGTQDENTKKNLFHVVFNF